MPQNLEIDSVDLAILTELSADADTPYTKVAEKAYVSDGTVHGRMRILREKGIVRGSTLVLDHAKLGYDLTAFIGVHLDNGSGYHNVIAELTKIPEIVEAHYITGGYSIFAKIVCRNTTHLRQVLNDHIQKVAGIQRTETFISLEERISRPISLK
jgi:Lrp/AsnC family transcriptional regulator for asnA, asnC and gidA